MPSPFPGMDPFIECQEWEDFHTRMNAAIAESISPIIKPNYFVRIERRVYVERVGTDFQSMRRADIAILANDSGLATGVAVAGAPFATATQRTVPIPEERRETYLVIRERTSTCVVTVIELLSPSNKRLGGNGRSEYLSKRNEILCSDSHLVEVDLLRGGEDLPFVEGLPSGDYFACVSRAYRRPKVDVYGWKLRQPMPTIPIPLRRGDEDVMLPLQEVFSSVYNKASYDLSIDYQLPLEPPLKADDALWVQSLLAT